MVSAGADDHKNLTPQPAPRPIHCLTEKGGTFTYVLRIMNPCTVKNRLCLAVTKFYGMCGFAILRQTSMPSECCDENLSTKLLKERITEHRTFCRTGNLHFCRLV